MEAVHVCAPCRGPEGTDESGQHKERSEEGCMVGAAYLYEARGGWQRRLARLQDNERGVGEEFYESGMEYIAIDNVAV